MREVGQRGHHAAGWWNLSNESVLACTFLTGFKPIRGGSDDARDRPEPNLGGHTAENDQPCGGAGNERRKVFPLSGSRDCFDRCDPEERKERRGVMKVNHPFRRAPGKKMLQKNWRGDNDPAWPQQRQAEKWKKERPKEISVSERLKKRSSDQLWPDKGVDQDVPRRRAQLIVQGNVIYVTGIQRRRDNVCAQQEPDEGQDHRPDIPTAQFGQPAIAFGYALCCTINDQQRRHVFLACQNSDEPEPMAANGLRQPRLKH